MNIFEYLSYPADHRKLSNKVTQLVKHWDEVVESRKVGKTFGVQTKKDGVCTLTTIVGGFVYIWSRTGMEFSNTSALRAKIEMLDLADGVYMGEMTCPNVSLEVLSGAVNPNRINRLKPELAILPMQLQMNWFDLVGIKAFLRGHSSFNFISRFEILEERYLEAMKKFGGAHPDIHLLPYVNCTQEEQIDHIFKFLVSGGEEGVVIRDILADWEAGHKGWRVMKMVKGVDYDLLCVGAEEGSGKYTNKVANLIFTWKDGKTITAMLGKGWTHSMAATMFSDLDTLDTPVGKIFQVYALEESSKGKLRLPKVGEERFDKDYPDV